jgi:two-component sensor histidine kinase
VVIWLSISGIIEHGETAEPLRAYGILQDVTERKAGEGLIDSRIGVRGPGLHLKPVSAQAIGLALHELATNAGKYGALSTDKGRVAIGWQVAASVFTMSWIENEGPPVVAPTRRGFGSEVIDMMAKHTLDGEVALNYAPSGLMWELTCPATNALEPQARERDQE